MDRSTRFHGHSPAASGPDGTAPADEVPLDLRSVLATGWHGKWIILGCLVVAGLLGYLVAPKVEPRYVATAQVIFDGGSRNFTGSEPVQFGPDELQNEIEILQSNVLIERVVDELDLTNDPLFNPRLRPPETTRFEDLQFALREGAVGLLERVGAPEGWIDRIAPPAAPEAAPAPQDGAAQESPPGSETGTDAAAPNNVEGDREERRLRISVINNVLFRLNLQQVANSRVIEIGIVSNDPETSARIANTIADQYIESQLESKIAALRAQDNWLTGRVAELRDRVQTAERAVQAARLEQSVDYGQSLEVSQQRLQDLNSLLSEARNEAVTAKATYDRLQAAIESGADLDVVPEFYNSSVMQSYRIRQSELEAELLGQRLTLNDDSPAVVLTLARLDAIRESLRAEAERITQTARATWQAARDEQETLETAVRDIEEQTLEQSGSAVEIRQLEREAQASQSLYENLLLRLRELSELREAQTADARILSPAEPPLYPLAQPQRRTVALALILGAMVGLALVAVREMLTTRLRSVEEIEAATGLPVLGIMPRLAVWRRPRRLIEGFLAKPRSTRAEAIYDLRTNILAAAKPEGSLVLMFASALPKEGKSLTSALFALTCRQLGKSAVLVDCDLRKPRLAQYFGIPAERTGLLAALDGEVPPGDLVFEEPRTGLHILAAAPISGEVNPADRLSGDRFERLLSELRQAYDYVIIDSPPALLVSDAAILAQKVDGVVHAVRWNRTSRDAVLASLDRLAAVKAPLVGMVMTRAHERRAARHSPRNHVYRRGRYKDYFAT